MKSEKIMMKIKKTRLLDLKLDEKNNFVFEAKGVKEPYVYEMCYKTKCNMKNVLKMAIMEAFDTYKIPYTEKDICYYMARMMGSKAKYLTKRIKGILIEYLKLADIIIDNKNTFRVAYLTAFIEQMFNDWVVSVLKLLVLELIDCKKLNCNKNGYL